MASRKVIIVGGGIAGLTLAIGLRQAGIAVDVLEEQPSWRVLGVGISLTGPTLRALRSLGLIDQCVAVSFGYSQMLVFDREGAQTGAIDMPRLNGPDCPAQVAIERRALHDVLLAAAEQSGARIRLGLSVRSYCQDKDSIALELTDGSHERCDLMVGADGLHSKVRAMAFPDAPAPRFTGLAVWRYTMARPPAVDCMHLAYGGGNKPGLNPVSPQSMFLFLVQKIESGARLPYEQLPALLRDQLTPYKGTLDWVREQIVDPALVDYRPMESLLVPAPWYRGRIVLIGDAAHTTTPHLATGAGIAIEDTVVLAEELANDAPIEAALANYMKRRFERCRLVVDTALLLGEWEKDPTIPASNHVKLIRETYATLAAPI
ncbi:MAG: 2-polyprenyl-6-methoxyphenol hydroxylase [Betaproteobacteria bacterium]|nr:2-polyprenyl-6-methoxyphenol hydroxylase [Betaproteobacteria bacterium]